MVRNGVSRSRVTKLSAVFLLVGKKFIFVLVRERLMKRPKLSVGDRLPSQMMMITHLAEFV